MAAARAGAEEAGKRQEQVHVLDDDGLGDRVPVVAVVAASPGTGVVVIALVAPCCWYPPPLLP